MRLVPFLPHGHALALDAIMSPMAATPSIPFSCEATAQRGVRTFFPLPFSCSLYLSSLPFSLFFNSPILPRFSLFCLPLLFSLLLPFLSPPITITPCPAPPRPPFSRASPSVAHYPYPILSYLTRPHALPPFMARSCPSHPRRIGSATRFLRRGRQYACQRHDGTPLTCYCYIRR